MQCIICGCTEEEACVLAGGEACGWALLDPPLCTNPDCLAAASCGEEIETVNVSVAPGRVVLDLSFLGQNEPISGWLAPDAASEIGEALSKAAALARLRAADQRQPMLFDAAGAPLQPKLVQP